MAVPDFTTTPDTPPHVAIHTQPGGLSDILKDDTSLAIWNRPLSARVTHFARTFAQQAGNRERFYSLAPGETAEAILPDWARQLTGAEQWLEDVHTLLEMYHCLFEPAAIGLRLHVLQDTMCPRFHTDRVPVRLLCTYTGPGTQWLANSDVCRREGPGPLPDQPAPEHRIHSIPTGAVALLKGEAWVGNEGKGLVHRSPATGHKPRLVMGFDWLS